MRNVQLITGLTIATVLVAGALAPAMGQPPAGGRGGAPGGAPAGGRGGPPPACAAVPSAATAQTTPSVPAGTAKNIAEAITNPARPAADVCQDQFRKPAEMLKFANVTPDTVIAEYIPGAGYFTRIFGKAVSGKGHVYTLAQTAPGAPLMAVQTDPAYGGKVSITVNANLTTIRPPVPVDLVWTSRNYHDLNADQRAGLNKAAFEMLKPGGTYIILDHAAVVGTGDFAMTVSNPKLHRIDENLVKLEVLKAGFKLVGENNSLRNTSDTHLTPVFDGTVRGDTDQFILKFEKPKDGKADGAKAKSDKAPSDKPKSDKAKK